MDRRFAETPGDWAKRVVKGIEQDMRPVRQIINIADLRDPDDPQGRSYREVNAEKQHVIPVGTLVELEDGVRLFVVWHGRDCDQTPLYWLSPDRDDTVRREEQFMNFGWYGGYAEDSLVIVRDRNLHAE